MTGLVARMATRAVAISNAVGETLAGCGERLRVVPNGIDLHEYEDLADGQTVRREFGIEDGQPVVTTIGRLEHWKGQHVLVEAMPVIVKAFPDVRFLIVGGVGREQARLPAHAQGAVPGTGRGRPRRLCRIRSDIPALLAASNVVVLPTCTAEPFGRTVVEAMAAARPVVATAAGGPLDTVVDSETGVLVWPDDAGALPTVSGASWPTRRPRGVWGQRDGSALSSTTRSNALLKPWAPSSRKSPGRGGVVSR